MKAHILWSFLLSWILTKNKNSSTIDNIFCEDCLYRCNIPFNIDFLCSVTIKISSNYKHIEIWNLGNLINLIGSPNPRPWSLILSSRINFRFRVRVKSSLFSFEVRAMFLHWHVWLCAMPISINPQRMHRAGFPMKVHEDLSFTNPILNHPFPALQSGGWEECDHKPGEEKLLKGKQYNQGVHVLSSLDCVGGHRIR